MVHSVRRSQVGVSTLQMMSALAGLSLRSAGAPACHLALLLTLICVCSCFARARKSRRVLITSSAACRHCWRYARKRHRRRGS